MKASINGIEINYEIDGNGPWLTMSHSLACNLHMWDPQMAVLTKTFKVLRFDRTAICALRETRQDLPGTGLFLLGARWMTDQNFTNTAGVFGARRAERALDS